MNKLILSLTALLIVCSASAGDILTLTNQMVFDGKITKIKNCVIVFKSGDAKYYVPAEEIYSIQFADTSDRVYTDYLALSDTDMDKCMKGRMDAVAGHGKKTGHFLMGILFGPLAMIGTALASPTPQKGQATYAISKNRELFDDPHYLKCYKRKAKAQLIGMEALGWGAWLLFVVAINS